MGKSHDISKQKEDCKWAIADTDNWLEELYKVRLACLDESTSDHPLRLDINESLTGIFKKRNEFSFYDDEHSYEKY